MPFSAGGISDIGGGISDLFAVSADRSKAQGDRLEAQNYGLAAGYADQEAAFTKENTAIQEMQAQRELYKSMGQTTADVAGAGFATSGSAIDLLRQSASQGALQQAVLARQGLITEQGYEEQSQSYLNMESAANMAAGAEDKAAIGAEWTGGIKIATGLASMFTGMGGFGGGSSPPGGAGSGGYYGGAVEG
jgi:hypothetical protein